MLVHVLATGIYTSFGSIIIIINFDTIVSMTLLVKMKMTEDMQQLLFYVYKTSYNEHMGNTAQIIPSHLLCLCSH